MVSDKLLADIVLLRGLGYTQKEIAKKTGSTLSTVQYNLTKINEDAQEKGDVATFTSIMVDGFLPEILDKAKILEKLV